MSFFDKINNYLIVNAIKEIPKGRDPEENGNGWRLLSSTVCRVSWNSPRCFEPLWRTWMERQISTRLSPALPSAQAAMNARWSLHGVFCPTWGRPLPSNQIRSQSGRCGPTSRRASFQAWKHPSWKNRSKARLEITAKSTLSCYLTSSVTYTPTTEKLCFRSSCHDTWVMRPWSQFVACAATLDSCRSVLQS